MHCQKMERKVPAVSSNKSTYEFPLKYAPNLWACTLSCSVMSNSWPPLCITINGRYTRVQKERNRNNFQGKISKIRKSTLQGLKLCANLYSHKNETSEYHILKVIKEDASDSQRCLGRYLSAEVFTENARGAALSDSLSEKHMQRNSKLPWLSGLLGGYKIHGSNVPFTRGLASNTADT